MNVSAPPELGAALAADRRLAHVHMRLEFLLNITPVNAEDEWAAFRARGYRRIPVFRYRPLPFDPATVRRDLAGIDIDSAAGGVLARMLQRKAAELDRAASLLACRDTPEFRAGSIELYGAPGPDLVTEAEAVLAWAPQERVDAPLLDSADFALLARAEIDRYRGIDPQFNARVEIWDDFTGIMVLHGNLVLGPDLRVSAERAEALIQHEIGTHVVTAENGRRQPLKLLHVGLAGYDETQEALALFSEYAAGHLCPRRVRLLAARVVAAHRMIAGVPFAEVFAELVADHGFDERSAWTTTMRAFRAGGTPKDVIYLRGLIRFLAYLRRGGSLEPLLVGKMPLESVPLAAALMGAGVLQPPAVRPRWLDISGARVRMDRARAGIELADLVAGSTP